ncbi:MAG: hypothetical protein HOG49_30345 [Candidatus Scalindua sp.]|jgi:hypothetical protein|nr:hypothetical protein [Candidatus Scalindua sp.]
MDTEIIKDVLSCFDFEELLAFYNDFENWCEAEGLPPCDQNFATFVNEEG